VEEQTVDGGGGEWRLVELLSPAADGDKIERSRGGELTLRLRGMATAAEGNGGGRREP
jgi:hypothetical protein